MLGKTRNYTVMIFDVLDKLISKQVSPKQLAGPVGIVQMSGVMALSGVAPILDFMALISVNLAVMNLLPLLITDGGMLLFLCLERFAENRFLSSTRALSIRSRSRFSSCSACM